ncbi:MAG: hypothetical protein KDI13_08645 [Alphaproteobacteria bacterium]|nr:hypothetical protein [Alphaproteobacteria bacterium]
MATTTRGQETPSLTEAFQQANHLRHYIMDASMFLMAIGAAVTAAGPLVGIFDPITPFISMHFQGFQSAFDHLPTFFSNAWDNMQDGVLSSGIDIGMNHLDHGVSGALGHAAHTGIDSQVSQFNSWTRGLSPAELADIKGEANDIYGMSLWDYFNTNFLQHGL